MSKKVGSDKLKAGVVKVDKMDFPYTIRKDRKTKPLYARFGREVKNYKDDGTPLPSANSSYCQVCSGLSPPSNNACRAHT